MVFPDPRMLIIGMILNGMETSTYTHKSFSGFTFIELILYIGILSMVMVGLMYFVFDITSSSTKSNATSEVEYATRFAVERIQREIIGAVAINTTQSTFGSTPGRLSLQTASPDTNPTIIQLVGTSIVIKQGAYATQTITTPLVEVMNTTFYNLSRVGSPEVVQFLVSGRRLNPQSVEEFQASTTITSTATLRQ